MGLFCKLYTYFDNEKYKYFFEFYFKKKQWRPLPENANLMFSSNYFSNCGFLNARIVLFKAKTRLKYKFDNLNKKHCKRFNA